MVVLLPNGIRLSRRRTPIGVLGVIYEARPNVTIDIATLCLKTGNAVILRGGSETLRSNIILVKVIQKALKQVGLPVQAVQYISNPDRALVTAVAASGRICGYDYSPRWCWSCTSSAGSRAPSRSSPEDWVFAICTLMTVPTL